MNMPLLPVICLRSLLYGVLFLGALFSTAAQAEIYKWKDANGVVRYSDIPPPANVQVESMQGKKKPVSGPQKQDEPAAEEPGTQSKADTLDEAKRKEKLKEAETLVKKENCEKAKSNLEALSQPGAYRLNEKGERVEFDEASIAKEKEIAKRDIERNCK